MRNAHVNSMTKLKVAQHKLGHKLLAHSDKLCSLQGEHAGESHSGLQLDDLRFVTY